jgi:23S rRNA (pseudouridine1915-N3)-methyltransferase
MPYVEREDSELMKWRIHTVGKPALSYARQGAEEYLKRLRRFTPCEHHVMRSGSVSEIHTLVGPPSHDVLTLVLDERGEALTTQQMAQRVDQWQLGAIKRVHCFIGGADGHAAEIRAQADHVLQMSAFTLQHELALVVWLEQLYRVYSLLKGTPYHR